MAQVAALGADGGARHHRFDEVSELRSAAWRGADEDPFEGRIPGSPAWWRCPSARRGPRPATSVRITGPDMPRRCYWVRRTPSEPGRGKRDGSAHGPAAMGWAQVHRWDLLCACLRERRQAQIHTPHDGATAEVEQPLLRSGSGTRPRRSDGRRSRASAVKGRSPDGSEDRGQRTSGGRGRRSAEVAEVSAVRARTHTPTFLRTAELPQHLQLLHFCKAARGEANGRSRCDRPLAQEKKLVRRSDRLRLKPPAPVRDQPPLTLAATAPRSATELTPTGGH